MSQVSGNSAPLPIQAVERAVLGQVSAGVYELGGPEVCDFRTLMVRMLSEVRRRRLVINLPFWVARLMAAGFSVAQGVTLGLFKAPLTRDQVANLANDNIVSVEARGFDDLGISPTAMDAIVPDYLWRFRPSGQYDAIKESARNLRT